ncbi:hypothetical protein [Streptomyces sp. NBC_00459]
MGDDFGVFQVMVHLFRVYHVPPVLGGQQTVAAFSVSGRAGPFTP